MRGYSPWHWQMVLGSAGGNPAAGGEDVLARQHDVGLRCCETHKFMKISNPCRICDTKNKKTQIQDCERLKNTPGSSQTVSLTRLLGGFSKISSILRRTMSSLRTLTCPHFKFVSIQKQDILTPFLGSLGESTPCFQ